MTRTPERHTTKDPMRSSVAHLTLAGLVTASLILSTAACATTPANLSSSGDSAADGHGAIAGAEEVPEPQLGITMIDPEGTVTHLDLLTESVSDIGEISAPEASDTDGRYVFVQTDAGIEIVDSGVWTWDHVDHFHYYRAAPALLGSVAGDGDATIATTNLSTAGGTGLSFADSGEAVLLDTEALSKGEIRELFRIEREPHAGLVVPIGSFALVTDVSADTGATVVGYTSGGDATGLEEACVEPAGTITTRVGVVIGCRDGVLLAHVDGDELQVERIPYPAGSTAPAVRSFDNREGRPTVAGLAGTEGIWVLDTRERSWSLLPSPAPLVHVTAVDDEDGHLLALTQDGRVLVLDDENGAVLAETAPLVAESLAAGKAPTLIADQHRAYLSAPVEHALYEIDYADAARIARTFDINTEPAFVAETGR